MRGNFVSVRLPLLLFGFVAVCPHAEVVILPADVVLNHQGAQHQLLVEQRTGANWEGDLTVRAQFQSSDPQIASVDEHGTLWANGNGTATITATVEGQSATATVEVKGIDAPYHASFRNDIEPLLFRMGCSTGACHGAAAGKNGFKLSLRGFDIEWDHKVLTRQANGRRVSLVEPEESLMLLKPTMQVPHEGGKRFEKDSETYRILLDWIQNGAPAAPEEERRLKAIRVLPESVTLGAGAEQQILVQAHYTDGTYSDATRRTKFGTTDESVAVVDEGGKVAVKGPGAVSVTAWYSGRVATARLTVPRPQNVAPDVYRTAKSNNYIDELVLRQLRRLQIAPAGEATDREFIRRAYLDAIGILPTLEETTAFLADSAPAKRAKLIDQLLERPEYTDYWAYKWSDLLLLSSKNIPRREELSAFYRYIRESVAQNKPWDQFVREILTATGSTLENGAANYFVMHKETVDLTETTSQAFLGMSITCARCHNHPLEKWTQDDYFGMANLFARVKLKNGRRGNDTEVLVDDFGDVIHPRLGKPVPPRPLDGETMEPNAPEDRREHLARWLTAPENPYFTRAVVNRVWRNFMGRGLVEPEDDLRLTNPALNEELMQALCDDLVEHQYDLKHLIRRIMNSATYQRSSRPADTAAPDDKHYSQYLVRRLSAEVLLDAYSQVTGVPTEFAGYPAGFRALQLPDSQIGSYFLSAFGRPARIQTCSCERTDDSNVAQTLHVANGDTLNGKLRHEKSFLAQFAEGDSNDDAVVETLFVRAVARPPSPAETQAVVTVLTAIPREGDTWKADRRQALEDLAWAVLTGKEFIFNH
ncbi:MAG: DUF1549 domain-containing protein [Candidatus Hydrogenedentes bacterium]|nr:DUF1549 domain-containing protein [Candidatus Hydrogenedentota bacterium]